MKSGTSKFLSPHLVLSCLFLASSVSHGETLMNIYEKALENDPQLRADQAALEAGREEKNIGLSNLLPQITASASYTETDSEDETGEQVFGGRLFPGSTDDVESTSESVEAVLSQPLFNMSSWYQYKIGSVSTDIAEVEYKANKQAFIIRVAEAYFNVLRAIDTLQTAQAEERALGSQLEQTRQRYEVGLTAITDVHEAQAAYDEATATMIQARGELGVAYEALEVLTGEPEDTVAPMEENFPVNNPMPAERGEWVSMAMSNNYSLQQSRLNADRAKMTANQGKSAHLPTLGARVTYSDSERSSETESFSNTSGLTLSESDRFSESTSVSLRLDIPVFSGGGTSARRRQAHQQYLQRLELYTQAQRETVQSTRSLHLQVETAVATVKAREQQIVSSESALEATQAGYEVGTRTLVDVLLAQQSLYQAQRAYYNALYDYILATLNLKQAAGTLSAEDLNRLNEWLNAEDQVQRSELTQ